jgi:uncharacterized membrane protein
MKEGLKKFWIRFRDDQSAIIWVWAVALLSIVVHSITWMVLCWPMYATLDAIELSYTFPSVATNTINLIRSLAALEETMFVLGMLLWAFINSARREDVTYPVG